MHTYSFTAYEIIQIELQLMKHPNRKDVERVKYAPKDSVHKHWLHISL